jgi:uncharacterized repeat protein (TIGR01451 family)
MTKTGSPHPAIAGSLITYTLSVRNAGPGDAQSVTITDNVPSTILNPQFSADGGNTWSTWTGVRTNGTIAANSTFVLLIRGTVSPSVTNGTALSNTASVSSPTNDPDAANNSATDITTVGTSANLSISKRGTPHPVAAGQLITYTIIIHNSGPSDAANVDITDAVPGVINNPEFSINGGFTWNPWVNPYHYGTLASSVSGMIMIRGILSSDVANGTILRNTASVSCPATDPVPDNNTDTDEATVSNWSDLSLTKVSNPNPVIAGDMITYTIAVANRGYSDALGVTITDNFPATILTPEFSADNGTSWRAWVSPYTVGTVIAGKTSTILIRGLVAGNLSRGDILSNSASVSSTTFDPSPGNNTATDSNTVTVPHPNLVITKATLDAGYSAVGDIVHYRIIVYNNSLDNLYNITVSDTNAVISSGSPIDKLEAYKTSEVLAYHIVTQADIDAGEINNAVTANGINVHSQTVKDKSNMVVLKGTQRPQITASKYVAESRFKAVGETIHYTIEVFNCGNVTIKNIRVYDGNATITGSNTIASLAPRATVSVRAEHVVTQEDIDAGKIINMANVEGFDPTNKPVRDDSNVVTLFSNQPDHLTITKLAKETSFKHIGDTIHYEMTVKNYRTTYLSEVTVYDPNAVITTPLPIWRIESDKSAIVKAYHVINQHDLDSGRVVNTAVARGKDFYGFVDQVTSNEVTVFAEQHPMMILTKTAEESTYQNVGDLIHYTNEIRNDGNIRITGIVLTEPDTHYSGSNKVATLDPGEKVIIRTIHTVTQLDLNVGVVEKTASISGLDANSQPIKISSNPLIVKGIQNADLTATLTAAENTYQVIGEMIHYTVSIRNTGNITLTKLTISTPGATIANGGIIADLLPGNSAMFTAEHLITPEEVSAGRVIGRATVICSKPDGGQITRNTNDLTILAGLVPGLSVTTVATESSYKAAGEIIHYAITVKNSGNGTFSNIRVSDPNADISSPLISVQPYGSTLVEAVHTVTQADLDAGVITNTTSISGQYPNGTPLNNSANPITVYAISEPKLFTTIYPVENSFRMPGDLINYTIEVTNTGNLTISNITLASIGELTISGTPADGLKPGEKAKWLGAYEVKTTDMDAGKVARTVEVAGIDPQNQAVGAISNQTIVNGIQSPELSVTSTAAQTAFTEVGETISYSIVVKNSGNVSIISTAVTDPNAVIVSVRPNVILMPGESFKAAATHVVTQDDMDAGKVITVANAEGFDLAGHTIRKPANQVIVYGIQLTEIDMTTTASSMSFKKVGEVIRYEVRAKNTGNISLLNVELTDPNVVIESGNTAASLLPGQSIFMTASRITTQDDLDTGEIINIARANAIDRNGVKVVKSSDKLVIIGVQNQELTTTTTASVPTYKNEGDQIRYTVVIRNTGNVTMKNVTVTDAKDLLDFRQSLPSLAPGAVDSLSAVHTVTLADINAGRIVTAGIAHGYSNSSQFSYLGNETTVKITIDNYNLTNYPNPFSYETTIVFDLPEKGKVILKVFDITGQEVGQIEQQDFNQGRNYVHWRTQGEQKGQYILKMYYNGATAVKMVTVIN